MISLKVAKGGFFDREAVLKATEKATLRVLSRFGAFVRRRSRSSIRKRKKSGKPGMPPSSHTGKLKDFIFFTFDGATNSVVIGPTLINRSSGAPDILEHGGSIKAGTTLRLGREPGRDASGRFVTRGTSEVTLTRAIPIAPRPYMGPALEAELPGLPAMWANSVKPKG